MMRKIILATITLFVATLTIKAQTRNNETINEIDEVVVTSSTKETQNLWKLPSATTFISPLRISLRGIESLKDLTSLVPNLYIPDYGSKMSTPIYLRGIGTRSSNQSVGVYVDGIPYMDKSAFDFEMTDIQRIEVLRGPQGTLYGRNAMGGIINIYTVSPLNYQGTKVSLGAGNYGSYKIKASHYTLLNRNVGMAVSGYYDRSNGFFTNEFNNEKADEEQSAGGRLKIDWKLNNHLLMKFETAFDYTDQGAFPYGMYHKDTKVIDPVNYSDKGSYRRSMLNNNLRFEYSKADLLFSSSTGHQYLDDDMMMDQDFTAKSIFTINQRQKQNSINQEFALRSTSDKRYKWSVGIFGFYNDMKATGDVVFKEDGVKEMIQGMYDAYLPPFIKIDVLDKEVANIGTYKTPTAGIALFHQSTYDITDKLSVTGGIRLDYEKQWIDFDSKMLIHTQITLGPPIPAMTMPFMPNVEYVGELNQHFSQFLPKLSLKYEFDNSTMAYATVSKGYKAGGYNNQMFAEIVKNDIRYQFPDIPGMPTFPAAPEVKLDEVISYRPEITWNYELGGRFDICNAVKLDASVFYMDVHDLQLTKFVEGGGNGRILSNSGIGRSFGAEISATTTIAQRVSIDVNYGYTNAKFKDYDGGTNSAGVTFDYTDNFIPYTPQHTFSLGAAYRIPTYANFIEQVTISANYNGCGKIYWTEANDVEQPFYGLLNAKVSFRHKIAKLDLWANNITSTEYGAFYFESSGNSFIQKGKPFTFGANLTFTF